MADKMMRIAGRDSAGLAKAIKTDSDGKLDVNLKYRKLMTETVSNRTIPMGSTFSTGFLETGGLKELVIDTVTSNFSGYSVSIKEFNYNDNTAQIVKATPLTNESGGVVFSGAVKNKVVEIESPYVVVEVKNISTSLDLGMGLYVIAKDPAPEPEVDEKLDVNLNYRKLMTEVVSNRTIPMGSTYSTGFYETGGLKELVIDTITNNHAGYNLTVKEYNYDEDTAEVVKETSLTNENGGTVFSGATKNITATIDSPYVNIEVENISTTLDLRIGLYIITKNSPSDTEVSIKNQNDLATEKTLALLLQEFSKTTKELPKTPLVKNVNIKKTSVNYVQDFQNGLFYGTYGVNIFTSPDGSTWTPVASIPSSETTNRIIEHLFKTDTGRLVCACYGGDVFISDETGVFGSTPSFSSGTFNHNWGTTRYANIIGFTTYEPAGLDAGQKHEAWLSVDNGATFKNIFDNGVITNPKFPTLSDTRTHLHDIEYDPYSGRIWVWAGDFDAQSLYYSDTMGATWELFGNTRKTAGNATQLVSNQYGLALGADTYGGGLGFISIDRSKQLNPIPVLSDLDDNYWRKRDLTKRYLSTKKWIDRENSVYLIPAAPEYDEDGRKGYLAFSENGKDWTVIWESPHSNHMAGLETIVYGNGKLVGAYNDKGTSGYTTFTADLKIFSSEE